MEKAPSVLVADDQPDILHALRVLLRGEGCQVKTVNTPEEALEALSQSAFEVALIDLNYARDTTSGKEGMDLLEGILKLDPDLPVVVMTAWATIDLAVECMRKGAADFIQKPWENARVKATVANQAELYRAKRKATLLEDENRSLKASKSRDFLAQSEVMKPLINMMNKVAPSDANILITGENGTGKGVAARYIHSLSARSDEPSYFDPDLARDYQLAVENLPEYISTESGLRIRQWQVREARRNALPQLDLTGSYGHVGIRDELNDSLSDAFGNGEKSYSVGAVLSIPFPNRSRSAERTQAYLRRN